MTSRQRTSPWERLPTLPEDAAIWDRDGQRFTAYVPPGRVGLLRSQTEFLLALVELRMDWHAGTYANDTLDTRLDAVLDLRRRTLKWEPAELEMLIPMANRYRRVLAALPESGTTISVEDFTARFDLGITSLDLVQMLDRWLLLLSTGQQTGGDAVEPAAIEDFAAQRDWLAHQLVDQLNPAGEDHPPTRFGLP